MRRSVRVVLAIVAALLLPTSTSAQVAQLLQEIPTGVGNPAPTTMSWSADSTTLYAGFADGTLRVFRRNPGALTMSSVVTIRDGEGGFDGLGRVVVTLVTPDRMLYVASHNPDQTIAWFRLNQDGIPIAPEVPGSQLLREGVGGVSGLARVVNLVASSDPEVRQLLAATATASTAPSPFSVFDRDLTTGALTQRSVQTSFGANAPTQGHGFIRVSPDNQRVVLSSGSTSNPLAPLLFLRRTPSPGPNLGDLVFELAPPPSPCGLYNQTAASVDNAGSELLFASINSIRLVRVSSNQTVTCSFPYEFTPQTHGFDSGRLFYPTISSIRGGRYLFATVIVPPYGVEILQRSGDILQRLFYVRNGEGGLTSLLFPLWVAVSPDERSFVVPVRDGTALPVFSLNLPADDAVFKNDFE